MRVGRALTLCAVVTLLISCGRDEAGDAGSSSGGSVRERPPGVYRLGESIPPGKIVTYYAGPKAPDGPRTLSKHEIFWDRGDGMQYQYTAGGGTLIANTNCGSKPDVEGVMGQPPSYPNKDLGDVSVSYDCFSDPETVTIANHSSVPLIDVSIASLVLRPPTKRDTFPRHDLIPRGGSIAYYAGKSSPGDGIRLSSHPLFGRHLDALHIELESGGRRSWVNFWCTDPRMLEMGADLQLDLLVNCKGDPTKVVLDSKEPRPITVTAIGSYTHTWTEPSSGGGAGSELLFVLRLRGTPPPGDGFYAKWRDKGGGPTRFAPLCGDLDLREPAPPCRASSVYRALEFDIAVFDGPIEFVHRTGSGRAEVFRKVNGTRCCTYSAEYSYGR